MPSASDVFARRVGWAVDTADARRWVGTLPANSVQCVVTSPPYWGQRDYGTGTWEGGDPACDHLRPGAHGYRPIETSTLGPNRDGISPTNSAHQDAVKRQQYADVCKKCGARRDDRQIGLEDDPARYVAELVGVFRGVRRALHPTGTLWLNLGDKMRDKQLLGLPWRVAFALQEDGWYLRQHLPWLKGSGGMPESADDRPCVQVESVFLLTKSPDYFFDMESVRVNASTAELQRTTSKHNTSARYGAGNGGNTGLDAAAARVRAPARKSDRVGSNGRNVQAVNSEAVRRDEPGGSFNNNPAQRDTDGMRNWRCSDFWYESLGCVVSGAGELLAFDVPTHSFPGAHFAVMPEKLVRPMVLAGTPARGVCPACGAPWVRLVEKERMPTRPGSDTKVTGDALTDGNRDPKRHVTRTRTVGWGPGCRCDAGEPVPAVVCDPFAGAGTVLKVAVDRRRRAAGCELNPRYADMARRRVGAVIPDLI